jgi:hypothetical protein
MAEDDDILLPSMAPKGKNDDDLKDDAVALFDIDLDDAPVLTPIDLNGDGGEGATSNSNSNSATPSVAGTGNLGKRKSPMWVDFDEVFEEVNGVKICTKAVCKMCKSTLFARSVAGTGHLKRHQKSCRLKTQRARVQSRLFYNPDGSIYNWDYKPDVARLNYVI